MKWEKISHWKTWNSIMSDFRGTTRKANPICYHPIPLCVFTKLGTYGFLMLIECSLSSIRLRSRRAMRSVERKKIKVKITRTNWCDGNQQQRQHRNTCKACNVHTIHPPTIYYPRRFLLHIIIYLITLVEFIQYFFLACAIMRFRWEKNNKRKWRLRKLKRKLENLPVILCVCAQWQQY